MTRAPRLEIVSAGPIERSDRPPLLLVHGARHAAWCWAPWQRRLTAAGWASAAVSLRGHGASAGSTRRATLRDYVDDVVHAAGTVHSAPVLIGHSLGGLLVQRAALRTPVRGVVLLAPLPSHSGLRCAAAFARRHPAELGKVLAGRPLPLARADLFSAAVPEAEATSALAHLGSESAIVQFQVILPRRTPRSLECPVLLLGSSDDAVVPVSELVRSGRTHGVQPRWFSGLGHDLMLEPDPGPLDDTVTWLGSLD